MAISSPPADPPPVWVRAGDPAGGPFYILVSNLPDQTDAREFRNFVFSLLHKKSEVFVGIQGEQKNKGWVRIIGFSQFENCKRWLATTYYRGRPIKVDDPGYRTGGTGAVQIVKPFDRDRDLIVTHEDALALNKPPGVPAPARNYTLESAAWGYQAAAVPRNAGAMMQPGPYGVASWMGQSQPQQHPQHQHLQAQLNPQQQPVTSMTATWGQQAQVALYHGQPQVAHAAQPQPAQSGYYSQQALQGHLQAWSHPQQQQQLQQQQQSPISLEAQAAFQLQQAAWSQPHLYAVPSIPQPYFQPVQPGMVAGMPYWGFPQMPAYYGPQAQQPASNEAAQAQAQAQAHAQWVYQQQQFQMAYAGMFQAAQQQQQVQHSQTM
ncbi:hypothetical protein QC763_120470 [Podospora pseudopauciseta]|uniref:RRM domain-containing protein n=1 Tax=Podospora pseudopauciseta TaxID=2093780 RepID=A0ABR0I216_9PEZI|nr:hypothetical protein QC763_120470 [Podospora pseudopauciseta]